MNYLPPLHINTVFNANDYNYQNGSMTYGYAENRYIRKIGSDTVSGTITFTNQINISGLLNITGTVSGLTKTMVGLDQVDNTSDINKPVSSATASVLSAQANRIITLESKTTNMSFDSSTSKTTFNNSVVFSGTINGSIDSASTINEISATNFDYNGSINSVINGTTGTLPVAIRTLNLKTTGQSYTPDYGDGDTTTLIASNLCCNLLYINNSTPSSGTDIGTQITTINGKINTINTNVGTNTTNISSNTVSINTLSTSVDRYINNIVGNTQSIFTLITNVAKNSNDINTINTQNTNQSYSLNTTKFTGETQLYDMATSNSVAIGNNLGVAGISNLANLQVLNDITCSNLNATGSVQYDFKMVGYIVSPEMYGTIPLCKSILNPSGHCSGTVDLVSILYNTAQGYLYLFPSYKLVMYDDTGLILFSVDNTSGTDITYTWIPTISNLYKIIIYNNNVVIL